MKHSDRKFGEQITEQTTAPASATPAYVAGQDPEFLDSKGVFARFGIRRSLLYAIKDEGRIRTVALRRKGRSRGKRLFDVQSLRAYLREKLEGGDETS
jgi:hypothetical protein